MILSIKDAIKPGIFQTFYKPYTKDQIKNYFTKLQVRKSKMNKEQIKNRLQKKMTTDFELKVNTEHFINDEKDGYVTEQKNEIKQKLFVGQSGLRTSPDRLNIIDLKGQQEAKAKFEKSQSKKDLLKKHSQEVDGATTTLPGQSRLLGEPMHASQFSFNEPIDKETLILMSLNQSKMMQNVSAEKFKMGMKILYEDE